MPNLARRVMQYAVRLKMFRCALLVVLIAAALLQGCAQTVDPKKVHRIDESTTRAEVEELLGEPVEVEETDDGQVYTYSYTIDADETGSLPDLGGCVGGCAAAFLLILPATWITDASGAFDETETLLVAYGADDRVAYAETEKQRERRLEIKELALGGDPEAQYQMGSRFDYEISARRKWLRLAAAQGHTDAMYTLGMISNEGSREQWNWYCQAAVGGNAEAQFDIGRAFSTGSDQDERDLIMAYLWFNAARINGYVRIAYLSQRYMTPDGSWACCDVRPYVDALEEMGPDQIAKAVRLATEWKPTAEDCYVPDEAQATN